jgi:hypothetical protein
MKKNKFNKIYEIGSNAYSILKFNGDIFIGTETFLKVKRKKINQGFKSIELTAPLSMLFDRVISAELVKEDKEFPDMNRYAKIDGKALRKDLKDMYDSALESEIDYILNDFKNWCNNFKDNNAGILPPEQMEKVINTNRNTLNENIETIKKNHKLTALVFKEPRITDSKDLYTLTQLERFEFLYSQRVGASLKINYFYDLDDFGVVTIYKVQTVRGYVKSIETFIFNREIINKIIEYMAKHNL